MDTMETIWNVAEVIFWIMAGTGAVGGLLAFLKHLKNKKEK